MNVREFVSQVLQDIVRGLMDAQERTNDTRAFIVPSGHGSDFTTRSVEFDIALTTTESKGSEAEAKVAVWSIGAGAGGRSESSDTSVSRVKFVVPVSLPWHQKPKKE
jgi:hypothetical protein